VPPDDGRWIRPKHVEAFDEIYSRKTVHQVGFPLHKYIEIHAELNKENKVHGLFFRYDVLSRRNAYIRLYFYLNFYFMKVIF